MKLMLGTAIALSMLSPAIARPQLHTASIGWISPKDITCEPTSDHTCFVREDLDFAYTSTKWKPYEYSGTPDPEAKPLYRVKAGTELLILDSRGSDLFYDAGHAKGDVEVAIVIPADWGKDDELHPIRKCQLKTHGSFPQIVSLSCGGNGPEAKSQTGNPSFNCQNAKAPDEVAICQTPKLSEMDAKMANLYSGYRKLTSGPARHQLEVNQVAWLLSPKDNVD